MSSANTKSTNKKINNKESMKSSLDGFSLQENFSKSSLETSNQALINLGKRQRKATESLSTITAESAANENSSKRAKQSQSQTKSNEESLGSSNIGSDDSDLLEGKHDKRLVQNRKSAMKCRLKKKAEFDLLKKELAELKDQSIVLNQQYRQTCLLFEDKVRDNLSLKDKLDQIQQTQTAMLAYVLSQLVSRKESSSASPLMGSTAANNSVHQSLISQVLGSTFGQLNSKNFTPSSPLSSENLFNQILNQSGLAAFSPSSQQPAAMIVPSSDKSPNNGLTYGTTDIKNGTHMEKKQNTTAIVNQSDSKVKINLAPASKGFNHPKANSRDQQIYDNVQTRDTTQIKHCKPKIIVNKPENNEAASLLKALNQTNFQREILIESLPTKGLQPFMVGEQ